MFVCVRREAAGVVVCGSMCGCAKNTYGYLSEWCIPLSEHIKVYLVSAVCEGVLMASGARRVVAQRNA